MTKQGENQTPSNFDARADNAALSLRQSLKAQGRPVADQATVAVGKDGKPPAPPPPVGSYMRQAMEARRASDVGDQPPAGTIEQAMDGSQAPRLPDPGQQTQPAEEPISPRAERRIKELTDKLRIQDQDLQNAIENGKKATETAVQFQTRLASLEQQHQQMLQSNLDNLDPVTRGQVMQDARMAQRLDEFESRIISKIQPQLQQLQTREARHEMADLANKYPAFDFQIHGPLIDMFRGKNPHCSIDQAFRAIAEPEELVTRRTASAQAVPPVVAPGNGSAANVRYAPQPEARSDPQAELVDEARRLKELRASTDPAKQKEGYNLAMEHLKRRIGR